MTSITADFSSPTGIVGCPLVFGQQDSPQMARLITGFMQQGFVFERLGLAIYNVVPKHITLADYKANVNNVQDASTWNYGYLEKLRYFQQNALGNKMIFMVTLAYAPPWLSCDGKTTGVPNDMGVWCDIVMKIGLYMKQFPSVRYIEVWNEPEGKFLTLGGSPYTDRTAAYLDIYLHTAQGIRASGWDVDIGGPAACHPYGNQQLCEAMLGNAAICDEVKFLSFHEYDEGAVCEAANLAAFQAVGARHGRPNIPVFLTEWNYTWKIEDCPLNSSSTDAISYVGRRLVNLLKAGYAGANIFRMAAATDNSKMGLNGLFVNNTFTPKVQAFQLLSSILGLGHGESQIMETSACPQRMAAVVAAVNSRGQAVLCAVNDRREACIVDFMLSGLQAHQEFEVTMYEASAKNLTSTPRVLVRAVADAMGNVLLSSILINEKSVAGLVITLSPKLVMCGLP
ncbi:MAG: hypothetical protein WDW38_001689 [Sanguina aurantia]